MFVKNKSWSDSFLSIYLRFARKAFGGVLSYELQPRKKFSTFPVVFKALNCQIGNLPPLLHHASPKKYKSPTRQNI